MLLVGIRREIAEPPFVGEGHKKLRARLAARGIHTSGKRVLRLTREAGCIPPWSGPHQRGDMSAQHSLEGGIWWERTQRTACT